MSKTIEMTLSCEVSAFVTVSLPGDTDLSPENLVAIARKANEDGVFNGKDVVFEPEWGTADGLRIVCLEAEDGCEDVSVIPVEPQYYKAGQALHLFLNDRISFDSLVERAVVLKVIDAEPLVVHRGVLQLPAMEAIEVEFEVRQGASKAEKDLAFLKALAQVGVSYVADGAE